MHTMKERLERFDKFAERGILRFTWTREEDGRARACLLTALSEEAYNIARDHGASFMGIVNACPATLMPGWFAEITPKIDDNVSVEYWPKMVKEFRTLAEGWEALSPTQWEVLGQRHASEINMIARDAVNAHNSSEIDVVSRNMNTAVRALFNDIAKEIAIAKGCAVT